MPDEFRLSIESQDVEFKAFFRHFEHEGREDEDENLRRGVLYVFATLSFPDSGWNIQVVPVEGTEGGEWLLLEDPPGFSDGRRSYYVASGATDHEIERVPESVRVRFGRDDERGTSVNVVPWD